MKFAILLFVLVVETFSHSSQLASDQSKYGFRRQLAKVERNDSEMEHVQCLFDEATEKHMKEVSWKCTLTLLCVIVMFSFIKCAFMVFRDIRLTIDTYHEVERHLNSTRHREKRRDDLRRRRGQVVRNATRLIGAARRRPATNPN